MSDKEKAIKYDNVVAYLETCIKNYKSNNPSQYDFKGKILKSYNDGCNKGYKNILKILKGVK